MSVPANWDQYVQQAGEILGINPQQVPAGRHGELYSMAVLMSRMDNAPMQKTTTTKDGMPPAFRGKNKSLEEALPDLGFPTKSVPVTIPADTNKKH